MKNAKKIALLGQPTSGKSTIFNHLTGSHQHVGNWSGKTVEKIIGEFIYNGSTYLVADLPGTYSLSANSDEEIITRDYIANGEADLVCILADASQPERSMFMLADFAGIKTPVVLVLTMIDVAQAQGKNINIKGLSDKLGIPVVAMIATDKKKYVEFMSEIATAISSPRKLNTESMYSLYENGDMKEFYKKVLSLVPKEGINQYSAKWLASKLLEGDTVVAESISEFLNANDIDEFINGTHSGSLYTSDCKFTWIENLLPNIQIKNTTSSNILTKFDQLAISKRWGRVIAIGIVLIGITASMIVAASLMTIAMKIPVILNPLIIKLSLSPILESFLTNTLITTLAWVLSMTGFVFGVNFVFGLIEEIGYMSRVSYVFDNTMNKLGLQGKSIMSTLISFGCTIGGAAGTRVIDSWGQRVLTIALAWAVPCGATFAVIPTLATAIYGETGVLFAGNGSIMEATTRSAGANLGTIANAISKPKGLTFIIAVTFNVPCLMALSATLNETHSLKWTFKIALYYIASALVLSCITYHIANLFF